MNECLKDIFLLLLLLLHLLLLNLSTFGIAIVVECWRWMSLLVKCGKSPVKCKLRHVCVTHFTGAWFWYLPIVLSNILSSYREWFRWHFPFMTTFHSSLNICWFPLLLFWNTWCWYFSSDKLITLFGKGWQKNKQRWEWRQSELIGF